MKKFKVAALAAVSMAAMIAPAFAGKYLVIATKGLPADLEAQVSRAGGVLETVYPFGVAIVSGPDGGLAGTISGAQVVADYGFDVEAIRTEDLGPDYGNPPASGDNDPLFNLQWGHNYVGAVESWNNGHRGAGVRVAVLDGGFDLDHPDLVANVDFAASADMTGQGLQFVPIAPNTFSHGSHTSGTIGAADNGIGTIGVAPEVELVLVKVLFDTATGGSGTFEDVIEGIYHAANQNVQVINMSLGGTAVRGGAGTNELSLLANAVKAAMAYATEQGVTVIVSAGNAAADLDGDGPTVRFQTGLGHNLGISALGPNGWAKNPNQSLNPSYYTNYGTSMVDFAAPGGDFLAYPLNDNCTISGITRPCWVFDGVMSLTNNGWAWAQGTSMAAPHAAGVAALIISETGNSDPEFVFSEMRKRAVDGGKKGRDDFFGHGTANTGN